MNLFAESFKSLSSISRRPRGHGVSRFVLREQNSETSEAGELSESRLAGAEMSGAAGDLKFSAMCFSFFIFIFSSFCVSAEPHWEFAGWHGGGCYPNLTFDPNVKGRVYLTSDVAGVWRSNDLGEHWDFATQGLGHLMVAQVAVAPSDSNVVYAATGRGVFVSKDAGGSWTAADRLDQQISFIRPASYRPLAVHPQHADWLCVGTAKGRVFCSKNFGAAWQDFDSAGEISVEGKPITALSFDPSGEQLYVASAKGFSRCSLNQNSCQLFKDSPPGITDFVLSQKFAGTFYLAGQEGLWITHDGGKTWNPSQTVPQGSTYRVALDEAQDRPILWVIWNDGWDGGVLVSDDQGKTWTSRDQLHADPAANPSRVWARKGGKSTSLHIDPFEAAIMFRTDWWGVWRSDDAGLNWHEKILGAPNHVITDLTFSSDGSLLVSSMDNGILRSRDGGKNYEALLPKQYDPSVAGHFWRLASVGQTMIATSSPWDQKVNQVVISSDQGETFQIVRHGLPEKRPRTNTMWGEGYPRALAVDPQDSRRLYLGIDGDDGGGLFISADGGFTWQRSTGQPAALRIYNALAVDPTDSSRIAWGAGGKKGGVYLSRDAGKTFQQVFKKMPWVFSLAFSSDGTLYVAGDQEGAKLFAGENHGKNWKLIGDFGKQRALVAVAVDPANPKRITVGTVSWGQEAPCTIHLTSDGGANWQDVTGDLPDGAGAAAMAFSPDGRYLYIGRSAGSVYRLAL